MRKNSLDLLRILSTIAVIIIHCNAHYFVAGNHYDNPPIYLIESLTNTLTRFSVPAFVMISGAFNLQDKNADFKGFYSKAAKKVFLPMLPIFLIIYITLGAYQIIIKHEYVRPLMNFVTGGPFAYWFMYMLLFLYILTPFIVIIKRNVSIKVFEISSVFLLVWACFSQMLSAQQSPNTIGVVFAYLSYYLIGSVVYTKIQARQTSSVVYLLLAILMFAISFVIRINGFSYYETDQFLSFFSPLTILASVLIFMWFCSLDIKFDFSWLSAKTYYIYLFHDVILVITFALLERISDSQLLNIGIVVVFTFALSLLCAVVYSKIWNGVKLKFVSNKPKM